MYEMYPEIWAVGDDAQHAAPARPRRRPRKAHSVLPAVIARQVQAAAERRQPVLG
jgi:hypothetical protein